MTEGIDPPDDFIPIEDMPPDRKFRDRSPEYRNRTEEQVYEYNARRTAARKARIAAKKAAKSEAMENRTPEEKTDDEFAVELRVLEKRTRGNPTDADADINFAYRNMAMPTVTPIMAPSISGWSWYLYARSEPNKFLEICAKREDAKAKQAGTITNQRMEDDRRSQFAVIGRLEKELTMDVAAIVGELLQKFPADVLRVVHAYESKTDRA